MASSPNEEVRHMSTNIPPGRQLTPESRREAQSRLRTLTTGAILAATGATVVIGVAVAREHPGSATTSKVTTGASNSNSNSNSNPSSSSSSGSGSTGSSTTTGSTGNTGTSTTTTTPTASSSTPSVISGGSSHP